VRIDYPDDAHYLYGVISKDQSSALFSYVQLMPIPASHAAKLTFRGLKPGSSYRVSVIHDAGSAQFMEITNPTWIKEGAIISGSALDKVGLPAPILRPENALLLKFEEVNN
jgi:alpha-galactosidase